MPESYSETGEYRFNGVTLDLARGGLYRDGIELHIRPRSFDVLRYLIERPGKLVSRDELMDALWSGTVVTEDAVTQCLIDIRRAIGDETQTMIRTVPRRGYIFELPVERVTSPDAEQNDSQRDMTTRSKLAGVLLLALVLGIVTAGYFSAQNNTESEANATAEITADTSPSIAVMPFENMSPDSSQTYFVDGVSEEIINSLVRQQGLKVIARTSSFSFRDQNVDVATIAERLDVSHVLEGSVRNDGDALRINVKLVDAGSENYVWNGQFDRELSASNIFAIQSEIATAVVESLQAELTPQDRAMIVRVPTENMTALEAYFEARQAMETRQPAELDRAADLLRNAVELDPGFALAYVSLAETLRLQSNYGSLPQEIADEQGMAAVTAALAIDDRLGQAYASLGNLLARAGNEAGAEQAFLRGIQLSPSYAPLYQWLGEFLVWYGRAEEGLRYSRIAVALDPRSPIINVDYAEALAGSGRLDEALSQYDAVLEIDPDFTPALTGKAWVLHDFAGRIAEAVPLLERARSSSADSPFPMIALASAYIDLGDLDRADALLVEATRMAPEHVVPKMMRLALEILQRSTEEAARTAESIIASWGGFQPAMQFLRDRDLAVNDFAAALDRYQKMFPELFDEAQPNVDATNYRAAIDVSLVLMRTGRQDLAKALLNSSLRYIESRPRIAILGTGIADAKAYAILGDHARALELLSDAVDGGWRSRWEVSLMHDLAFAGLRDEDEFAAIVEIIRMDMARQLESIDAQP